MKSKKLYKSEDSPLLYGLERMFSIQSMYNKPTCGKSHQIAVKLGLKDRIIEPDFTFEKIKETL